MECPQKSDREDEPGRDLASSALGRPAHREVGGKNAEEGEHGKVVLGEAVDDAADEEVSEEDREGDPCDEAAGAPRRTGGERKDAGHGARYREGGEEGGEPEEDP